MFQEVYITYEESIDNGFVKNGNKNRGTKKGRTKNSERRKCSGTVASHMEVKVGDEKWSVSLHFPHSLALYDP